MTYALTVRFELDADTKQQACELMERLLEDAFGEPWMMTVEASAPRWVAERPASFAERYPGAA